MKPLSLGTLCLSLPLAACGASSPASEAEAVELSDLQINSAKRQCATVAVLQQVPNEAAKEVCGCTVDSLIEDGTMTATAMPSDEQQQAALDRCIDQWSAKQG